MASRKEYEMLFQLNAQLSSSFSSAFKSGGKSVADLQKEISSLNKIQSNISGYQRQERAVEATTKKLANLKEEQAKLQAEYEKSGKTSVDFANKLIENEKKIDNTTASLDRETQKLNQLEQALKNAGVDTSKLSEESMRLGVSTSELAREQERAAEGAEDFGSSASAAFLSAGRALASAGIAAGLKEILGWFVACTTVAMEFETAMAGVRRTVGGSTEDLAIMAKEFTSMSTQMPITTTELGAIAETAGQLGVARESVTEFTEVMAMLATTTDLSADNAATMLAQFANITGLDPADYGRLGDAVAELGDATATTASKVVDMSQGLAAAASIAGFSETDILAYSATLGSLGIEAQAGSTALSTLIQTVHKSVKLGGEDLEDFASIANMTAGEFASAWGSDAAGALDVFIQGLNDTERNGKDIIVLLDELGITNVRQTKAIQGLAQAGSLLSDTMAQANNAWAENTALQGKADIMYGTTESKLIMLQNAYANLQATIGGTFTPELKGLYDMGTKILVSVNAFIEKNPGLVKGVTAFLAVLLAASAALAAYIVVTKVATAATALFGATAMGAIGYILALAAAGAGVVAMLVGIAGAANGTNKEYNNLTASSQKQHDKLQALNKEYELAQKTYGETDNKTNSLRYEVDQLTASYEQSKQTLEEFRAETDALVKSHDELMASSGQAESAIRGEEQSALALAFKLDQLQTSSKFAIVKQEQMKSVINELNESVPGLAVAYDEASGSLNMTAEAIERVIRAEADRQVNAERYQTWLDLVKEELSLKDQLATAEENLRLAQRRSGSLQSGWTEDLGTFNPYREKLEELTEAYNENQGKLEELNAEMEAYEAAQIEAMGGSEALKTVFENTTYQMGELATAYENAHKTISESMRGQYELWDEAKKVDAMSAGELEKLANARASYWERYDENISDLSARAASIPGLAEMLADADGSEEYVNMIAGLATGTDEQISAVVAAWQREQEARQAAEASLADFVTGFSEKMGELLSEFEKTVEAMDMGDLAAESAKSTINSFIAEATSGSTIEAVRNAYGQLGQVAANALSQSSKSTGFIGPKLPGFAGGTESAPPGYALVGELGPELVRFAGGEKVYTAEETQQLMSAQQNYHELEAVAFAPQFIEAMSPVSAHGGSASGLQAISAPVNIVVQGDASRETVSALENYADTITAKVLDAIANKQEDADRGRYR